MLGSPDIDRALRLLGSELARRGVDSEFVLLGAASLLARQLIARATEDIDVLGVRLPDGSVRTAYPFDPEVRAAIEVVTVALDLDSGWIDDRPGSAFEHATPSGFEGRLERAQYDRLVVWHLARVDLIATKAIAAAERWGEQPNKHVQDLVHLRPTTRELEHASDFIDRVTAPASASRAAWAELREVIEHG